MKECLGKLNGQRSYYLSEATNSIKFKDDSIQFYKSLTNFFTFYGGHEEFWDIIKLVK